MVLPQTCLFPGRFQPFHNGHAEVVRSLYDRYERVVLSISQAHLSHTEDDPMTGGERFESIRTFLRNEQLVDRIDIIPVPVDAFPSTWVPFIRSITPEFSVVYGRNPLIREIFSYWGYKLDSVEVQRGGSGTQVRHRIIAAEEWESLVPDSVSRLLTTWKIPQRLQQLARGKNV